MQSYPRIFPRLCGYDQREKVMGERVKKEGKILDDISSNSFDLSTDFFVMRCIAKFVWHDRKVLKRHGISYSFVLTRGKKAVNLMGHY